MCVCVTFKAEFVVVVVVNSVLFATRRDDDNEWRR
jgi:hypothetical protein